MADKRWVSTTGDFSAAASYSPSGVPAVNDSIYADGSSQVDMLSGLTVFTAQNIARMWLQPPYQGDAGATGNPLNAQIRWLIHQGTGSVHFAQRVNSQGQTHIVVDSPNQQDAFELKSVANTCYLECVNGGVTILDGAGALGGILVGSRTGIGPFVTIGTGVTAVNFRLSSGIVTTKSPVGTAAGGCVIDGGTLIYDALGTTLWNRLDVTGGTVIYNGNANLSEAIVSSGTLDMTQDSRAKTIAVLILMPGANYLAHDNITAAVKIDLRDSYPILP